MMATVSFLPLLMMICFSGGGPLPSPGTSGFDATAARLEPGGRLYVYVATDAYINSVVTSAETIVQAALAERPRNSDDQKVANLVFQLIKESGLLETSGLGVSSTVKPGGYYHNRAFVHRNAATGKLWQLFGDKPGPLAHLTLCPDSTAIAEFGEVDLDGIWQWTKNTVDSSGIPPIQGDFNRFRGALLQQGIDLDRILASVDGELGLIVTMNPDTMRRFAPSPDFQINLPDMAATLVLPVKNTDLFDTLQRLLASVAQASENGDRRILKLPAMNNPVITLEPVIVQTPDLLFIASTPAIVDACLATRAGTEPRLLDDSKFKAAAQDLPLDADGFAYVSLQFGEMLVDIQNSILEQANAAGAPDFLVQLFQRQFEETRPFFLVSVFHDVEDGWWMRSNSSMNAGQFLTMKTLFAPVFMGVVQYIVTTRPVSTELRKLLEEKAAALDERGLTD